jgi:hypothetical protein
MGYTTKFTGSFKFDKEPPVSVLKELAAIADDIDTVEKQYPEPFPGNYCQWVVTKKLDGIEWDRNEKFYDYPEWLQWLINYVLRPAGIKLSGTVKFQGEESSDRGTLTVTEGQAVVKADASKDKPDTLKELRSFRDFVLAQRNGPDLLCDWRDHPA